MSILQQPEAPYIVIIALLEARQERYGRDAYLARAQEEVEAALIEARRWQARAVVMTDYPYERKDGP